MKRNFLILVVLRPVAVSRTQLVQLTLYLTANRGDCHIMPSTNRARSSETIYLITSPFFGTIRQTKNTNYQPEGIDHRSLLRRRLANVKVNQIRWGIYFSLQMRKWNARKWGVHSQWGEGGGGDTCLIN